MIASLTESGTYEGLNPAERMTAYLELGGTVLEAGILRLECQLGRVLLRALSLSYRQPPPLCVLNVSSCSLSIRLESYQIRTPIYDFI